MNVIRKNIFWLLVSQLATWVATLASLVVVPNSLGSTEFGTFAYAVSYMQFFMLLAGLGTSTYLARAIARDHGLVASHVWNAVLLKFVLWAALSVVAIAVAYLIGNRGQTLLLVVIASTGMLPYLLGEVFAGALTGMQRMARPAMWVVAQVYFQTILGILVLELGGGVVLYTIVITIGPVIPTCATALMVRPYVRGNRILDFHIWRLLVVGGIPLLGLSFFTLLYGSLDVPILHALAGSDPVGWYGVAKRWVGMPVFIVTAVTLAYFPSFSMHGETVTEAFAPLVNRASHIVLFVTIPASVGLVFTADDLVRLIYRDAYDSSIVLIQILAIGLPIMALDTVLATALVASNRLKGYLIVAGIAATLNPIASAIAINITDTRYGNGAIGAAMVTVATELWVLVGALHFRSPGVVDRTELGRIGRIVAATAAMVPFLYLSAGWPLAVQVLLGLSAYAVASLVFGSISLAELRSEVAQMTRARAQAGRSEPGVATDATATDHEPHDGLDAELTRVLPTGDARPQP